MTSDARKVIARLLDTDARRRMTAEELIECSYIKCTDIRLTVFEQAGSIMRQALAQQEFQNGSNSFQRRFKTQTSFTSSFSSSCQGGIPGNLTAKAFHREAIKEAHICAVENLVSSNIPGKLLI